MTPVPIDALMDMPTYALSLLGRDGRQAMADWLPKGLRLGHLAVLGALYDADCESQRDLAAALRIHPTDMVALAEELERHELLVRRRDPADRRRYLLASTAAGRRLVRRATDHSAKIADELLAPLDPAERRTVTALLRRALAERT